VQRRFNSDDKQKKQEDAKNEGSNGRVHWD
jgi:hypothetical protein